ncbi:unnamed protein product [Brassica napus]|uniref:(rape) hypothetical protein n=1 Tax=Brassica napus TaxID=3708 RepID=A0A816KEG3_BRANA|nr:unnamed protein product [Brassica napus]
MCFSRRRVGFEFESMEQRAIKVETINLSKEREEKIMFCLIIKWLRRGICGSIIHIFLLYYLNCDMYA